MKNSTKEYETFSELLNKVSDMEVLGREEKAGKLEIWEQKKWIQLLLVLGMAFLDFQVVYQVLDRAMVQMSVMSQIMSFGLAFTLNFLPGFIVKEYYSWLYRLQRNAGAVLIGLVVSFGLLFFSMMGVRLAYRDMFMASTNTGLISNAAAPAENAGVGTGTFWLMILFSVSPLVTSVICGYMSYRLNDPLKPLIRTAKQRKRELVTEIHRLEYAKECLERDAQSLEELDNGRYLAAQKKVREKCKDMRAEALMKLEEYLGNADAVSVISEDSIAAVSGDDKTVKSEENETTVRLLTDEVRGA